jgi:hypothetical protein
MRKTLLIAAAALAAGVISSEAQVYSQNIVGYVNQPIKLGFNVFANPLDNSVGNSITNIIPPGATWDGTSVATWTGTGYSVVTIDSTMSTGVADAGDNFAVTAPVVAPGQAFFVNNIGTSNLLTIVGSVHVEGAGTGSVGVTTNILSSSPSLTFVASKLPVAGGVSSVLGLTNSAGALDGCQVTIPNVNASGSITGFTTYTIDSTMATGFADAGDNVVQPEPIIPVGGGFFFQNTLGTPIKWVQSL